MEYNKLVNKYTIINGTATKEDGTVLEAGKTYTASSLSEKIIFTSNGNISAQSSDGINTITSDSLLVSKIDTTVPTMSNFTVTSKTTNSITVKASGTDNESGITHYAFSKDNGLTWTGVQEGASYTFNGLTQYTDYQIRVRVYNGTYASGGRLYKDSEMQTIKTNAGTYTITLNGNGATTAGSANTKVTYASSTLSAITKPQRKYTVSFSLGSTGASGTTTAKTSTYTLNGWYTAASGGEKIINSDGTLVASTSYTNASRQWTKTSNVTLYAQWTSKSVTLPTVAKTGNTCKWGSYTNGATMTPTSNTTLTAICTANTYTITFNANGGQTSTSSKKVTYGSTYGDLPVPTYSGYTFLGWYTSATGGTNVINTTNVSITSNQTLYAQWGKQANVLTIQSNSTSPIYVEVLVAGTSIYKKLNSSTDSISFTPSSGAPMTIKWSPYKLTTCGLYGLNSLQTYPTSITNSGKSVSASFDGSSYSYSFTMPNNDINISFYVLSQCK